MILQFAHYFLFVTLSIGLFIIIVKGVDQYVKVKNKNLQSYCKPIFDAQLITKNSRDILRHTFDNLPSGIVCFDNNHKILLVNEKFRSLTNCKFEELINNSVFLSVDSINIANCITFTFSDDIVLITDIDNINILIIRNIL